MEPDCLPPAFEDCLLDSALDPVLDAAELRGAAAARRKKGGDEAAEVAKALLAVTVCDPACGTGGLLLAAARRIARRVARAREGSAGGQAPDALARALREVTGSCLYGVDASAEAVRAARDRLARAAEVAGEPPLFLEARVRRGNALLGAAPELIERGVPDAAFRPGDGDDRGYARSLRRANAGPVPGQATLFSGQGGDAHANESLGKSLAKVTRTAPGDRQAAAYRKWRESPAFRGKRLVADAWCAAFAWPKTPGSPPAVVNRVLRDLREQGAQGILPETTAEVERLRRLHQFFHWHLEFPDVFTVRAGETRWRGGFSCVLAAPPSAAVGRREDAAAFAFAAGSGAYPQCVAGLAEPGVSALRADLLFAERAAAILAPGGRAGCAVAPGTAAAPAARHLIGGLLRRGELASLYDFPGAGLCLLTLASADAGGPRLAFRLDSPADLCDESRSFTLTPDDAARVNPNTGGLTAFARDRDAALTTAVYRRVPALWDETRADGNPWKMRLANGLPRPSAQSSGTGPPQAEQELLDAGWERAGSAFTRDGQRMLPLYDATTVDVFDHRAAEPRRWVAERGSPERPGVADRLAELGWKWQWLCAWRAGDRRQGAADRTAVALFLPRAATAGSLPLMLPRVVPPFAAALIAAQSSLVFEYVARQKVDGAIRAAHWKQLPVPAPDALEPYLPFIVPRVLELACTDADLAPLARDLDDDGEPFAWDEDRRAVLRAELDAFFLRAYGIGERADAEYVIDALRAADSDSARTAEGQPARSLILAAYDRMAQAEADGTEYESRLFPPAGHGTRRQSELRR